MLRSNDVWCRLLLPCLKYCYLCLLSHMAFIRRPDLMLLILIPARLGKFLASSSLSTYKPSYARAVTIYRLHLVIKRSTSQLMYRQMWHHSGVLGLGRSGLQHD
ncbi:hypothetical protein OBBRIDRAFT_130548 [Obba rivulosa]|uniref:Uncharacterized protein n=1 Tax=Obba rivulosa TaxID=1052685 RepID=A0A8E2ANB1_9APHY|nr:hypothetical protein OBBRIDRAFT_130548 [Obba rivulosa]